MIDLIAQACAPVFAKKEDFHLVVQPSHIRKAGEGVVNHSSTIPLGVLFGPHPGEFIPLKYRQKAWEIINPESGDLIGFVDPGSAEDNSYPTAGWPRLTAPRRRLT